MSAVGDIFKVVLNAGTALNQFRNVFYYRVSQQQTSVPGSPLLYVAIELGLVPILAGISTNGLAYNGAYVYNLFDPTDFIDQAFSAPVQGTRTGESMPPYVAWGFRTARSRRDIRRGFKRFGIVSESDQANGFPSAGVLPALTAVSEGLSGILTNGFQTGNNKTFVPVIVKRIKVVDENGEVTYRDPESQAEAETADATQWEFRVLTTQNTRKYGRGI